ncbi:aminopeptidase P family protein [Candidatus Woesearchaeota archaeon]|nr:aminopeptidase P family protein [Candidatus Woesearchaeota archaeon]
MNIAMLKGFLIRKKIEAALFCCLDSEIESKSMSYFSGYNGIGCLIVPRSNEPFLVVPKMEFEKAKKSGKAYLWKKGEGLFETAVRIMKVKKAPMGVLGLECRNLSFSAYKLIKKYVKCRIKDISQDCLAIRSIKKEDEIAKIRIACKIADKILMRCVNSFRSFGTEADVEKFLHLETVKRGCKLAFRPIVASGKNSSMPHYEPANTKISKGFCVIDFGVEYEGYNSDITRTIYLGNPSSKEQEIYNAVLRAEEEAIKSIKVGNKCCHANEIACSELGKHAKRFIHGLGHGIGLNVHELPSISSKSADIFEDSIVFTIEPGVYFPGKFGIRIEDDILLRNGKVEILTNSPRNLIAKG